MVPLSRSGAPADASAPVCPLCQRRSEQLRRVVDTASGQIRSDTFLPCGHRWIYRHALLQADPDGAAAPG